ncbi:hypothetical protein QR680_013394 [Steinernema hermaphroditum]|uniref:Fatty-acid and retinol-binding protein 1 n=1 Tax=Steinernema hermaphroditum TaxID=289476 RepID=A0AA39M1H1_9BILA|nr:hypothetical protein QR680_013394 [Steinernema hermaphroditum]
MKVLLVVVLLVSLGSVRANAQMKVLHFLLSNVFRATIPREIQLLAASIDEQDYEAVSFFINATKILRSHEAFFPLSRVFPLVQLKDKKLHDKVAAIFHGIMAKVNKLTPPAKTVALQGLDYFDRYFFLNENRKATEAAEKKLAAAFDALSPPEKAEIEQIYPAAKGQYRGIFSKHYEHV